jgi:hypothetical protein
MRVSRSASAASSAAIRVAASVERVLVEEWAPAIACAQ